MTDSPRLAQVFKATSRGGNRQPPNKGIPNFFSPKKFGVFCVFLGFCPELAKSILWRFLFCFFFRHFPKGASSSFFWVHLFPKNKSTTKSTLSSEKANLEVDASSMRLFDDEMGWVVFYDVLGMKGCGCLRIPGGAWYHFR